PQPALVGLGLLPGRVSVAAPLPIYAHSRPTLFQRERDVDGLPASRRGEDAPVRRPEGLWRNDAFLTAWAGQSVSAVGSQVSALAVPLTAVVVLGAGPVEMGLLGAAQFAPALLLGLIAGVWVDRLPRRPILIAADLGRTALVAAVPSLALLGVLRVEHLLGIAFLIGSLSVLFDLAAQAYLPALVGREHIVEANSKFEQSASLAGVAGPSLAGLLVQAVGAPFAMALDAASFAASALCLARIRAPEAPPARAARPSRIWGEIGEGVRAVAADPIL